MGSYNNWNIINLTPKSIPFAAFDEIHQVVIDGISDNIASLIQSGGYGVSDRSDKTKTDFMLLNSSFRHIHNKIIQKLTDKLFLLAN